MLYAQALSSASSGERCNTKSKDRAIRKGATSGLEQSSAKLSETKWPRSPKEATCGRCFKTTHKTSERRHQMVCLQCSGVGHVVAKCSVEARHSPH